MATQETISDFKSGTDYATGKASTGVNETSIGLKNVADKIGQRADEASQTYRGAKEAAHRNIGSLEQRIRDKPVQSALIAAGAGFMISMFLMR